MQRGHLGRPSVLHGLSSCVRFTLRSSAAKPRAALDTDFGAARDQAEAAERSETKIDVPEVLS